MIGVFASIVLAAEEGVREIHELSGTSELLAEWAWLIPVLPLVAAGLIMLIGKRLPFKGYELAIGSMAFVALYGTALFIANINEGIVFADSVEVATVGNFTVNWGWVVDGLSIMMYFVVGVVGLFVFWYSYGYMKGDIRYTFFFGAFTLFAGAMLVLVASPNTLQLIVGWEGVGVSSYLLIGHYWEKKENSNAAIKAFLVNKVGDVGLFLGVIVLAWTVGSFSFAAINDAAVNGEMTTTVAVVAGLLIFLGAMGKSGQFPLHVWLPDAMAGPTPVSSLMHAATMVTAGVYLLARLFPFYDTVASDMRWVILVIGTITLILTGLLALVQDDIKKVLAYSTLSQLGYMVAALGAGAYTAGLFHLFTHAFFKALLFLGAGSVIHAVHSNNMSDMGGLRKYMKVTYWTFVIGSLALVGIIPFAGFFSKDEILASLGEQGYAVSLVIALIGAFITAFYMARTVFLTFFGEYKGQAHPHESPRSMTVPLVGLSVGAVAAGWTLIPGVYEGFFEWVGTRATELQGHLGYHVEAINYPIALAGLLLALVGLAIGYRVFYPDADSQLARDRVYIPGLYPLLQNKYYIDDFYQVAIVEPIKGPLAHFTNWVNGHIIDYPVNAAGFVSRAAGKFVYRTIDQRGIDYSINAVAFGTGDAGGAVQKVQTGKVQQYAGMLFVGAVLLVVGFIIFT
jgi:NADH-quinone oxidoreductase subunit L